MSTGKQPGSKAKFTAREFCIYREVTIERLTQQTVAERYKVSQGRVSQIVARVQQALDEATPPDDEGLAAARAARREVRECQERREYYLTLAAEGYRQSREPLVTTKTRTRGGEEEFVEKTERPQKANVQFLKLMVKLNGEMGAEEPARNSARGSRKGAGDQKAESGSRPKVGSDPDYPTNNDPAALGRVWAIRTLESVTRGSASLAEIEIWNFSNGESSGYKYPSCFEKSAESINGVRVADWVREHVPDERLPHGDEVWLPVEHNPADFDGTDREIVQDDTSHRFFNPNQPSYHFGRKRSEVGGQGSAEGLASDGAGERAKDDMASVSPSPTLPLSHSKVMTHPPAVSGPTRIERLLASERMLCGPQRRRLERLVARRLAAAGEGCSAPAADG